MRYKVNKEIMDKTTQCEGDFLCTSTGVCPKNKCKPTGAFNGYLWVETTKEKSCPYHISFGNGDICKCPTRNEIYRKYGV